MSDFIILTTDILVNEPKIKPAFLQQGEESEYDIDEDDLTQGPVYIRKSSIEAYWQGVDVVMVKTHSGELFSVYEPIDYIAEEFRK